MTNKNNDENGNYPQDILKLGYLDTKNHFCFSPTYNHTKCYRKTFPDFVMKSSTKFFMEDYCQ